MGVSWAILGPSWGHLGRSWAHLRPISGLAGASLAPSWPVLGPRCAVSALSGRLLRPLFAISEPSSTLIGHSGRIWGHLGAPLGLLGPNLSLPMSLRPCKSIVFCGVFESFLLFDRLGLISPILTSCSPTWNQFGAILGHLVPILGPSWKDPPRPSMHFFFSLSLGVAPKPHLNDLEPHLRAHPPHLQLSPA